MARTHHFPLRRLKPSLLVATALALAATFYFGYHAVHGRYGLDARARLLDRHAALTFERDGLEAARANLARDVALLSPDEPDPDLVEEIARDVLGFAYPEDRIIIEAAAATPDAGAYSRPISPDERAGPSGAH